MVPAQITPALRARLRLDLQRLSRAQEELRRSELRFRELARQAPAGLFEADADVALFDIVCDGGIEFGLSEQEFGLLQVLASNPGIVFSREALLSRVWRDDTYVTDRSVDALVKRLRRKIDEPYERKLLHTVRGMGYVLEDRGP